MHGGIDCARRGLGTAYVNDPGPADVLIPEGFTRTENLY